MSDKLVTAPDLMQHMEYVWRANIRALLVGYKEAGNIVDFQETESGFDIEPVHPLNKIGVRLQVHEEDVDGKAGCGDRT